MRRWLEASEYSAVLFEVDGRSVAYALYATEAEWIHLRQFFVERSVRRRGHGRKAVELLRREVRSANARVTLEVLATNPAGALFWRAVGFHDYALTLESGAARAAH
jgi:GNAT superfamily N-acetyltransferase